MFLGHFAVALAAKRAAPKTSLGTLVFGAQFLDLIWPPLVLLGVERVRVEPGATRITPLAFDSYPISHSLLLAAVWSVLIGAIYLWRKRRCAGALVLGLAVFSHWVLDWVTHRPDLQLAPGVPTRAGLGLWNHPAAAIGIESAMFLAAVLSYAVQTRAQDAVGRWGWISFASFLALVYVANVTGPPPPDPSVVAWMALALWILVPWAAWFDRHRTGSKKAVGPAPVSGGTKAMLVLVALLVAAPSHAQQPSRRQPRVQIGTLSDPSFYTELGTRDTVMAAWVEPLRTAECADGRLGDATVGCQPLSSAPGSVSNAMLKRLIRIIRSCTWVREQREIAARPRLDCGMRFRHGRVVADLGIALDSMEVYLFAEGERPARGVVPEHGREILRPSFLDPCDCGGAGTEGEFVYYEDPPSPLAQVKPEFSGIEERVVLHVRVDRAGRTCDVRVLRGSSRNADAATEAVKKWTWKPALSANKPVCVWVEVPIDFR